MVETSRFRIARYSRPTDEVPSPEEFHEAIGTGNLYEDLRIEGEPYTKTNGEEIELDYREKVDNSELGTLTDKNGDETEFCKFTYYTDTIDSALIRAEGNDGEEEDVRQSVLFVDMYYFEGGLFAFENRNELEREWLSVYMDEVSGYDLSRTVEHDSFPQSVMNSFYDVHSDISLLKLRASDSEDSFTSARADGSGGELYSLLRELGSEEFKSKEKSLSEISAIDQLVEHSGIDIAKAYGTPEGGVKQEISQTGSIALSWGAREWEPLDAAGQTEKVAQSLKPYVLQLKEHYSS